MVRSHLSVQQKRANQDLNIIVIVTFVVLGIVMAFQQELYRFAENSNISILVRVIVMAFTQFGAAGLGITIVSLLRKESFRCHGLQSKGTLKAVLLSVAVFIPYIVFDMIVEPTNGYFPFQSVWLTGEALASEFPVNAICMGFIATAWGFFEGFNYVVISDKINTRFPSQKRWFNWGAFVCAIMCLLIHGMVGVTAQNIIEAVTVFIIIYGMLIIKERTGSAWGCVFIFLFLWNAL
nr:hypothetical protein [uncultured Bacillus sp.]